MASQPLNDDNDIIEDVVPTKWVTDAPCPPDWEGMFTSEFTEEFE